MPLIAVLCISLMGIWIGTAKAEDLTVASVTNMAGLQRMLTQRIGKAYCQVGLGIEEQESREQLFEAVELFDAQVAELRAVTKNTEIQEAMARTLKLKDCCGFIFATNSEIREALARVEELWIPFRATATGQVSRDGARRVAYWSDDLLYATHKVVQLLQDVSNTHHARLVNISGRQRMLSQRLAKFYMLQVWGFNTLTIQDEMAATVNEFSGALAVLQEAPENTDEIKQQLDTVAEDWAWIRKSLSMVGTDPFPTTVASVSESILLSMDRITKLYEKLARETQRAHAVGSAHSKEQADKAR